jgi:hypothetical protein
MVTSPINQHPMTMPDDSPFVICKIGEQQNH